MVRAVVSLFASALLVLGVASPASAHISQFNWSVLSLGFEPDQMSATGTITCTAGETWRVTVRAAQKTPGYRAFGEDSGTCTGSQQNWSVASSSQSGDAVEARTRWVVVGKSFDGGTLHDKERIVYFSG